MVLMKAIKRFSNVPASSSSAQSKTERCKERGPLMDSLVKVEKVPEGDHEFIVYDWKNSDGWREEIIELIGDRVREIYAGYKEIQQIIEAEEEDLGFDVEGLKDCLDEMLQSAIPSVDNGGIVSTPRSDFPEIIASLCLEQLHGTNIPLDIIEKRDTLDKPGRGIDIIGYEEFNGDIQLILSEVKSSSEDRNPPQVITGKKDSLDSQLKEIVMDEDMILNDLYGLFRKAKEGDDKMRILGIIKDILQSSNYKNIILCPFLVREKEYYKPDDYKPIKDSTEEFEPFKIRFLAICLDDDIDRLSQDVYEYAASEVKNGAS